MHRHNHTITSGFVGALLRGCGIVVALSAAAACHSSTTEAMAAGDSDAVINLAAHGVQRSAATNDPPLTRQQRTDIDWLRSILLNPTSEPAIRSGAAVRLLNMQLPQSTVVLAEALGSNDVAVMSAVVEAMQQASEPVDGLLNASVAALGTVEAPLLDQLAVALARYGEAALQPIAALAGDITAPVKHRIGSIHALGAFRSKTAAVELMALLEKDRTEPEEIIRAACTSLQRGTGLPYGHDADTWREWWDHAKGQPREEWMSQIIRRLSEQLAAADQQIQREREVALQTEQRLAELYRNHFATLASVDEQLALLPPLLEDPLASVRGFALDRISRLLRDSVRISEELQHKISKRLDDEVPALRVQTLRLLDQLNYDQTSSKVAERLERETSPEVIGAFLDVLIRRPSPAAVEAVVQWLKDPAFGERAANVIWEATTAGVELPTEKIQSLRETLRSVLEAGVKPAHARLLVRVGDEVDVVELERLLDAEDETTRRLVAHGYYRRGLRQPLLDRAADHAVYPFAVRTLAGGQIDLATFRTLVLLTPPEQHRALWYGAVEQTISRLTPEQLLQADDLLASAQANDVNLRLAVLRRGVNLPAEAISVHDRDRIALRLGRLLLDLQQPAAAHEMLISMNGDISTIGGRLIRFEAAVLVGEYDMAAQFAPEPEAWLELLARVESSDPEAAAAILDEIVRRFDGSLADEHESALEAVLQRLQSNNALAESPA